MKKNGLSPDQLDRTLNHAEEMFERALCPFFLFGETLASALKGQLTGDKLELGVLKKHLTKEVIVTFTSPDFSTRVDNFKLEDGRMSYEFEGVPIVVKIVKRHYGCLANPDNFVYKFADFKIPNPVSTYSKIQGIIR